MYHAKRLTSCALLMLIYERPAASAASLDLPCHSICTIMRSAADIQDMLGIRHFDHVPSAWLIGAVIRLDYCSGTIPHSRDY